MFRLPVRVRVSMFAPRAQPVALSVVSVAFSAGPGPGGLVQGPGQSRYRLIDTALVGGLENCHGNASAPDQVRYDLLRVRVG